jgi:hypothetical protein
MLLYITDECETNGTGFHNVCIIMTINEYVYSGLSLNFSWHYIAEDMAWKVYAVVGSV